MPRPGGLPRQRAGGAGGRARNKPASLQKPAGSGSKPAAAGGEEDAEGAHKFQLELCWCIQQLEKSLSDNKLDEKQLQESWKVLQVLKNNNQPLIRKRQLMRTHFGDYRVKMAAEEKKLIKTENQLERHDVSNSIPYLKNHLFLKDRFSYEKLSVTNAIKMTDSPANPKAKFLRKSAFLTTGDDSFRFNFDLNKEQLDSSSQQTLYSDNTVENKDASKAQECKDASKAQECKDASKAQECKKTESKNFKFSFTNTPFQFNFKGND